MVHRRLFRLQAACLLVLDHVFCCVHFLAPDIQYDEDEDEITPDLWQEACWIVIRSFYFDLLLTIQALWLTLLSCCTALSRGNVHLLIGCFLCQFIF